MQINERGVTYRGWVAKLGREGGAKTVEEKQKTMMPRQQRLTS